MELVGEFAIKLSADLLCNSLRRNCRDILGDTDPEEEFSPETIENSTLRASRVMHLRLYRNRAFHNCAK